MLILPPPLALLSAYSQFILWRLVPASPKPLKLPIDYRTAAVSDAHDPAIWLSATDAAGMAELFGPEYGVGFVVTDKDPFFFLDIDNCLTPAGWSPLALEVLAALPGAAVEISQSGRGLHVIGQGVCPPHACKDTTRGLELYTSGRFVAITGTGAIGNSAANMSAYLPGVINRYFTAKDSGQGLGAAWTVAPVPEWRGITDDEKLIKKAIVSRSTGSIFGGRASFKDLWNANPEGLGKAFPDSTGGGRPYDASSADAALAQHLAFWTGKNCARIQALMLLSALRREKWEREDYLYRTIKNAVSMQKQVYSQGSLEKIEVPLDTQSVKTVSGYQYLTATLQQEHFKGCVYIQELHKIFTPSGAILKPDPFCATYGGYVFQLDDSGAKTTRRAWEAFTESQVVRYPKAHGTCFQPQLPPGALIEREGRILVNVYVPINTPRKQGDPAPFLNHLTKILPKQEDRDILLAYMAACVQHKGIKFQWAPLIQGAEGNGKTLLTRCLAYAIGNRYTHMPPAAEISEKFNEWLFNKLFIGVEDVFVTDKKSEMIEVLKPMISNEYYSKRAMQQAQVMGDNCANFILNTNYKNAIRITTDKRRFCVFYCAQQSKAEILRDGMGGKYFPSIYSWLRADGYAIVNNFLCEYVIPDELNPALLCQWAPETSSTKAAIAESLGSVEQEIIEAIEEERVGFRDGWISSVHLERLLVELHMARSIPHNKRKELLNGLGYDWHPGLIKGRANNPVLVDNGKKPRLFIKEGHQTSNMVHLCAQQVVNCYEKAQLGEQFVHPSLSIYKQ